MMGKRKGLFVAVLVIFLISGACSYGPPLNKDKFSKLNRAAQEVRTALAAGESYDQVSEKVQRLSDETEALKGRVDSGDEKQLLQAYSTLLSIYKDGLVLWRYKLDFAFFDSQLKGRIYVGQDVDPLVEKYHFPTESHLYKPTGQYWKSIAPESIGMIWKHSESQLKVIRDIANY